MRGFLVSTALAILAFTTQAQTQTALPPATSSPVSSQSPTTQPPKPGPFPTDAKLAYVDLNRIAAESTDGKAARAKLTALQDTKKAELQKKQEGLQAAQQKLAQTGMVLNESARMQLQKEVERLDRELQRATQDAQDDLNILNRDLMNEFQRKVLPLVGKVAEEKHLHAVFSLAESAFVWYDPSLDITAEVLKRLEVTPQPAAAPSQPKKP